MTKTCLVVDDVEVSQYVMGALLEDLGFECASATSASETMAQLDRRRFDVIFLDWHLRKVSGLQVVPSIREHTNGGQVPILVCTGVELDKELQDIASSGVQGLIKKPTTPEKLALELKRLNLI